MSAKKANSVARNSIARTLIPMAITIMEEEYEKPDRVKLTHYWLAEKLNIPNRLAFAVLAKVAQKKKLCRRFPNGPIYWDNDVVTVDFAVDNLIGNQNQEEVKPKHILYLVDNN